MASWLHCVAAYLLLACAMHYAAGANRSILVFGGNGFLGSTTVASLLDQGDQVTIVNRGNWYWDSKTRIVPRVRLIKCDRTKAEERPCDELKKLVNETEEFDAVYDFSSYGPEETRAAIELLKGKVGVYVYVSTDSIYDVCSEKSKELPAVETDAVRPDDEMMQDMLNQHHSYGHRKLQAEDEIRKQRKEKGGFPYVIFRLPDVIGPRDTSHRMWVYTLWIKVAPFFRDRPIHIPYFLKDYALSFVYVDGVAKTVVDLLDMDSDVLDEAYNLAWPQTITLEELLRTMEAELDMSGHQGFNIDEKGTSQYFYPSVRRGPINVEKAQKVLNWKPTPFRQAIQESMRFYEDAMRNEKFKRNREEIIQIVQKQLFLDQSIEFFKKIQELYDIDLKHFIYTKDEL